MLTETHGTFIMQDESQTGHSQCMDTTTLIVMMCQSHCGSPLFQKQASTLLVVTINILEMHRASDRFTPTLCCLVMSNLMSCSWKVSNNMQVYSSCSVIDIGLIMTMLARQHINSGARISLLQWCCDLTYPDSGSPDTEM